MASPGHALGHCKVKCSLCIGKQVWWSLHWGLQHCCAGGLRGFFRFFFIFLCPSVMQAVLGNHCAQSPASVWVASPGHAMGHCKVKCTLCSGQQVWWSLHWVLWPGWAGGLRGLRFC